MLLTDVSSSGKVYGIFKEGKSSCEKPQASPGMVEAGREFKTVKRIPEMVSGRHSMETRGSGVMELRWSALAGNQSGTAVNRL